MDRAKTSLRPDGLAVEGRPTLMFLDGGLRGVGQVMFLDNTYAGALFLLGVSVASWRAGIALFLGATVSTCTARFLRAEEAALRAGLHGYNGALVGVALVTFLHGGVFFWGYLVVAAVAAAVVTVALVKSLRRTGIPALTAPFVLVSWGFLAARGQLAGLRATASLVSPHLAAPAGDGSLWLPTAPRALGEGILRGVSQVFLHDSLVTGALALLGLWVASRRACVATLAGSALGLASAWSAGASEQALRSGLFGYNAALTSLALTVLLPWTPRVVLYAVVGSALSSVLTAAAASLFAPWGVPVLTAPFVVTVWVVMLAVMESGRDVTKDRAP